MTNVILIHTHDTGRYISPYGYPAQTNNLEKISNIGFTYRNAFTVAPTCSPSRAALLTGLYPHQNGMFGLAHRGSKLKDYQLHLSNFLKKNNYETALFGIQHEIKQNNISSLGYNHIEVDQNKNSSKIAESASNWLKKYNSHKPFFMSIGFFDTHREYPKEVSANFDPRWQRPPEIFFDNQELRLDMARFYTSLEKVDKGIGLILKSLEQKSKLQETLIIITTDHGIAWPGMKCNLNDHGTGIFLIAYMKNHLEGGKVNDDLVSNTDIFGTICKLCNLKKPNYLEDFILPNNTFIFKKRKFVFSEVNIHASIEVSRSVRSKRFRLIERISKRSKINLSNIDKSHAKSFLLKNGLKNKIKDQIEFYDIYNDPLERMNIYKNNFKMEFEKHKSILEDWRLKTEDPILNDFFKWPSGIMLTDPDEDDPANITGCTEKNINYGIIGTGVMGREHIRNIELIDNAQVVAICDGHKNSINRSLEIINNEVEVFESHNELIDANIVDAYIIATPNFTHIDVLKDLVKTNAHLLIEKPLCTTVEDCLHFKKLAYGYPGVIWTAMEYRYMPPVARFIEEIHKGTVGNLKMLTIREHRFPFLVKVNDWNRFSKNSGGTLVEKCCHHFDLMRLITKSEVTSVFASGAQDNNHLDESYNGEKPDILDNAFVIVNFENGSRGMLDLCMFAENSKVQEEICAVGHKGKIETSVPSNASGNHSSELSIGLRGSDEILTEVIEVDKEILEAGSHHGSTFYEHLGFINAIRNNSAAEVSLEDGLKAVAIGQAAEISIIEKRVVALDELLN